jgi:hypothetical protein
MGVINNVDFDKAGQDNLVPEGTYVARIDKVEERKGKDSGEPYWNLELTVVDPTDFEGRKVWDILMLNPQSMWKLRAVCVSAGISVEGRAGAFDSEELLQQEVQIKVIHEAYQGQARARVKQYVAR